jgi:hypothetical protein
MESISKSELLPRSSSLNSELIDEPEDDVFFDAAKNIVIKKLELEVLKEELESAKYQDTYPELENIYYKLHGDTLGLDDLEDLDNKDVIIEKIAKKEVEIKSTQEHYENTKKDSKDSHQNIISFVDTLDSYIKNKEDLTSIINDIDKKVKVAIPLSDTLRKIEESDWSPKEKTQKTERQKLNELKDTWIPTFKEYEKIIKEIRELFHKIYNDKLLAKNDELYIKLSGLKVFNTDGLFYKATYDSREIKSLFDDLYNNVFETLKDYELYNGFVKIKTDPDPNLPGKKAAFILKKENDKLQADLLRLQMELSQIKRSDDLPKSRGKRIQKLRRLSELKPDKKKILNEKMNLQIQQLKTTHKADIDELNTEIEQLRSTSAQATDTQSIEAERIEELNKRTEVLTEQLAKKIAELTDAQKLVNTPSQEIDSELKLLESQEEPTGFLKLVIESANLYGKPEFKVSFEELLQYQPEDKFMFAYVFKEIEKNKTDYEYLDEFLKTQLKIPEQIEQDDLFPKIMGSLTFKPSPQTHL